MSDSLDVIESELENEKLRMISWWILEPPNPDKKIREGVRANQAMRERGVQFLSSLGSALVTSNGNNVLLKAKASNE